MTNKFICDWCDNKFYKIDAVFSCGDVICKKCYEELEEPE